ncbi:MAG: ABC transporter ATP-binding protein, partial [Lachnospiraceae bacterium]|nr:ABC transporter ATP-binding protein [Lachnospiraceae bacterium]
YKTGGEAISVLQDISMSANSEEMVAVMGPSGSGKTTLLQLLSGIDIPDGGNIFIKNKDICKLKQDEMAQFRRRHIGMIFQDFQLFDSLNVQENILLPLVIDEVDYELQEQRLQYILEILEIEQLKNKTVNEISGGQKQRVAIGRALIQNPDIVFADEPTGSLDMRSTKIVMEYMWKMSRELGVSFFIVTHDVYTASFCNRVLLLRDGQFIKEVSNKKNSLQKDRLQKEQYTVKNRKIFQDEIINMLHALGGEEDEFF